ncbi:MATE family efflux transporter [Bacteroides salyersiae]|jgi:O-antigen/teichoic acid export membrane protein|uniref:MATE family efflux transporter n=1 Tax=Bacteroides salyersiae TaxID=291644 RepID=UPI001C8C3BA6|nr:MATE family efflux transporter [Bacteroides salyersiae]
MSSNKLIVSNTAITYFRTLFSAFISLFTTRWVLQELGESDFGLYSVVGALISVLVFLSAKLSNGVARFYAYEIGKQDMYKVKQYFNTAFSINIFFAIIFIFIALFLGELLIEHFLNIPPQRLQSSIYVLRMSILSTSFSLVSTPFVAMFTARQNFLELAVISILQTLLTFCGVYMLRYISGDKLLLYSIIISLVYVIVYSIQIIRGSIIYHECRISKKLLYNRCLVKSLVSFSFWNILADLGHLLRTQGISILTNLFFSTSGNAALGVANSISNQSSALTNSLSSALSPAIISSVGSNDNERALKMSLIAPKVAIVLMFFFSIPFVTEINNILTLWLGRVPQDTNVLATCMVIMYVIEKTTLGQDILLQAKGTIAKSQTLVSISYLSTILFAYIMISLNIGIMSIGLACIFSMLLARISIIYCSQQLSGLTFVLWIKTLIFPACILFLFLFLISFLITVCMDASIYRLLLNLAINAITTLSLSLYILFDKEIRDQIGVFFFRKFSFRYRGK